MSDIKSILLAEDDPRDIELTLEAFSSTNMANDIVIVNDGEEVMDYLYRKNKYAGRKNGDPALILLDIKLPKVNGIEVLAKIKSDELLKTIPVVMLTSSKEAKDLIGSYNAGANGYVVKPVQFQEFIDVVKQTGLFWAVINEPPPVQN